MDAFVNATCSGTLCGSSLNCAAETTRRDIDRGIPWTPLFSTATRLLTAIVVVGISACAFCAARCAFCCRLTPPAERLGEYEHVENDSEDETSQVDADAYEYKVGSRELAARGASDSGIDAILDDPANSVIGLRRVPRDGSVATQLEELVWLRG